MEPRLVVFDLGRVLIRICDNWRQAFDLAGIHFGPQELDEPGRIALRELVFENECGKITNSEFCRRAGLLFGVDPAHVKAMSDVWLLGIYPGVHELLDELHTGGLQTACLSNTIASHWRLMSDPSAPCCLPLERLTYQFGSHLIGARKPDEAVYAHVERVVGMTGPSIVFFDDLPENVAAAVKRGWRAHRVLTDRDPVMQMREILCNSRILRG